MKTIGICGGMGPEATILFYQKIVKQTGAKTDQEHIKTIIYSNPQVPDRTKSIESKEHGPIIKELVHTVRVLEEAGADFIVIPCNTAHVWHKYMQEAVGIPVKHMIQLVGEMLQKRGIREVGLLGTSGTVGTQLYQIQLKEYKVKVRVPDKDNQRRVMDVITEIKSGNKTKQLREDINTVIEEMGERTIILGCTELPIVIPTSGDIIDPMDVLAKRSIEAARKK